MSKTKTIDTERFRALLLEERRRVERTIANLRDDHPGTVDDEVEEISGSSDNHLAETATATLDREIDFTLEENSGQVLAEIDAALKRIENGTYGICTNCGKPIAEERLEAYPWASLCIDDARLAEHR
jgi:RNA polymerase-binding protein DksA